MANIAIIPARGGSKRIPKKNIRNFLGKPIISYSIQAAIDSNLFEEIMVSTDDNEIAEFAVKSGAKVPFMRSEKNADDFASTSDVLTEIINKYKEKNIEFENGCCIYPAAPFIQVKHLVEGYQLLTVKNLDTVYSAVEYSYPIWRGLTRNENGKVQMLWSEYLNARSQDLEKIYHDAGQWYWFNMKAFVIQKKLFTDNSSFIELPETEVQDIDTEKDWVIAEMKYKIMHGQT
ncbi:MAG: pseudaminic acid cytidylyltransferase [Bacteroidia bacterium]